MCKSVYGAAKQSKFILAFCLVSGLFNKYNKTPIKASDILADLTHDRLRRTAVAPPHIINKSGFNTPITNLQKSMY